MPLSPRVIYARDSAYQRKSNLTANARITHIFSFSNLPGSVTGYEVFDALALGRYETHARGRPDRSVCIRPLELSSEVQVKSTLSDLGFLRLEGQVWLDGSGLAQLHLIEEAAADRRTLAGRLKVFCHERDTLTLDGHGLAEWLALRLRTNSGLRLRQDVLQIVDLPVDLQPQLIVDDRLSDLALGIIYRAAGGGFAGQGSARLPSELNRGGSSFAAHGRGVILFSGQTAERQEALRLTACELLFAVARARRARGSIESHLRRAQDHATLAGPWKDMVFLRALADNVRRQRIVLTLDVRAFADGLFMPELVIDDFRQSFAAALRLEDVTNSSLELVDTLSEVVQSYLEEAKLLATKESARRQRRWQLVVGIASGIAIPVALLLSYFGVSSEVNAPPDTNIFDISSYTAAWAIAILLALAVIALSYRQHRATRE